MNEQREIWDARWISDFERQLLACLLRHPSRFAAYAAIWGALTTSSCALHLVHALERLMRRGVPAPTIEAIAQDAINQSAKDTLTDRTAEIEQLVDELREVETSADAVDSVLAVIDDYLTHRLHRAALADYVEQYKEAESTGRAAPELAKAGAALAASLLAGKRKRPVVDDGAVLLRTELPPRRAVISGVLHQGDVATLTASSKAYKTWTVTDMLASVATGSAWWGFQTLQGGVVHVNFELPRDDYQARLRAVCGARGLTLPDGAFTVHHLRNTEELAVESLVAELCMRYRGKGKSLIVIDPLYLLMGGDENSAGDVRAQLRAFGRLAEETGAAIMLVHHFAKGNASAKDSIDRGSGSGVLARYPDCIMVMTPHEEEGAYTIELTLRAKERVPPFVVKWRCPILERDDILDPERLRQPPSQSARRRGEWTPGELRALLPAEGLTTADWQSRAEEELGMSDSSFERYRDHLVERGAVHKEGSIWRLGPRPPNSSGPGVARDALPTRKRPIRRRQ